MKLYEEFLSKMNMNEAPEFEQAIACELMKLVITDRDNQKEYGEFNNGDDTELFPEEVLSNKALLCVLDISGYWGNDLGCILKDSLKEKNIDSPLADDNPFESIFNFLDSKKENK